MEKTNLHTIYALIPHIIVTSGWIAVENFYDFGHLNVVLYAVSFTAFLSIVYLNYSRVLAHFKQFHNAKMRGYWSGQQLNKQVRKYFNASEIIKIKVTRGSIFSDKNSAFYQCIMHKNDKTASTNEIRILMHYPCQNSDHIEARAKAHDKEESEYLAELYIIIYNLLEAKKKFHLNLTIKLYGDQQIKWRYYIFKDYKKNKTLFLAYYDDHRGGNQTSMFRIRGSRHTDPDMHTLCNDFDREFDDIYENRSLDIEQVFNSEVETRKKLLECLQKNDYCDACHKNFKEKIQTIRNTFGLQTENNG